MLKSQVDLYEIYEKWTRDLGLYKCYFKTTPLASIKQCGDFKLKELEFSDEAKVLYEEFYGCIKQAPSKDIDDEVTTYNEVYDNVNNKNTLYIFDIPSIACSELAVMLNNELNIKPILVFNHIVHDFGIVGSKELTNNFIVLSSKLENNEAKSFAFMLDYDRYRQEDFNRRDYFNNQYELMEEDLPPLEILKELSINSFRVFLKGTMKDDLKDYIEYLKEGHIDVKIHNFLEDKKGM